MRYERSSTRHRFGLIVAATALLAASTLAIAAPSGRHGGPHDPGRFLERILDRLDVTDEQRDRIEQIATAHFDGVRADRERLHAARGALFEQIHAETFDESAIRSAAAAVAAVEEELIVARAAFLRDVREVLTPEQAEQFRQMAERRRGFGHDGPGGPRREGQRENREPAL